MSEQQVVVPDIGGGEGAEVIEVLVAVGDQVEIDQSLIVLESDKASMEIPSTAAGVITELLVKEGDELAEGAVIIKVEGAASESAASEGASQESAAASDSAPPAAPANEPVEDSGSESTTEPETVAQPDEAKPPSEPDVTAKAAQAKTTPASRQDGVPEKTSDIYAGPAVRKLAREFGVPLAEVSGTGPSGRVLKEDVQEFVKNRIESGSTGSGVPEVPDVDYSVFGDIDVSARSKLDKLTANNMHRSWLNVPHVTQFDNADITDLEDFRKSQKSAAETRGTRLTPMPFLLKACAVALRDNPRINSSLANGGEDIVAKGYTNIGMAVDTPAGLMVPVIRDVDRKTIWELAAEVIEMAELARDRKLKPAQMQGGCFTISSLGAIGGTGFTPIVNTPELAILGVSKASIEPVWNGSEFVPRNLLPLSLSYDHRAINGGDAGRFMTRVVELLSDIRQLSM